ncbi:MAG: transaldolase family protein [Patescibacteria group bacterium]
MKPVSLKTDIFLDSADPKETKEAVNILGFLDGQTTNPSLLAKNHNIKGNVLNSYRENIEKISDLVSKSVSIEVYSDKSTTAQDMFRQARAMNSWVPNAHIKFPITPNGIEASRMALNCGINVNMTLCFSQEQAAAVYTATLGTRKGDVFISPFVGRLYDTGQSGMDLVRNIIQMYNDGNGHVEVLTASVRNLDQFVFAIHLGSDIVTAPLYVLKEWAKHGMPLPPQNYESPVDSFGFKPIPYKNFNLSGRWFDFNITHLLTEIGLQRFADDWNKLLEK